MTNIVIKSTIFIMVFPTLTSVLFTNFATGLRKPVFKNITS